MPVGRVSICCMQQKPRRATGSVGASTAGGRGRSGHVTVYDIAQAASVSVSTVSRVLNNSTLVGSTSREAVLQTAARLGYEPKTTRRPGARAILSILVMLPTAERPHTHLFYDVAELLQGVGEGFAPLRIHTIAVSSEEAQPLDNKKLGDIDGCIAAFVTPRDALAARLAARGIPLVAINRPGPDHAFVADDPQTGMQLLLEHLSRHRPERRRCFVGLAASGPVGAARRTAFQRLSRSRLGEQGPWVEEGDDVGSVRVQPLLDAGARAFVCVNDLTAVAVYTQVLEAGYRIPDDVSVLGYDASPVGRLLPRTLTTVRMDVGRMGTEAAFLLRSLILERRAEQFEVYQTGDLIQGETT